MKLYNYPRSSAAFRVRIALNLKGVAYESVDTSLPKGEHLSDAYRALNPQRLVPSLDVGDAVLSQTLAIIEYLEETHPTPRLLPSDPIGRARVRSMALAIACDIHPLNNMRVLNYLRTEMGQDAEEVNQWCRQWIATGFTGLEVLARQYSSGGQFLYGDAVSTADVYLLPQIFNARRVDMDMTPFPTLQQIGQHLESIPAFANARPEEQPPR